MATIQADSGIAEASRRHGWIFAAYIGILVLTALFTWLVWDSGNKVQDAVRRDADARIEEAKSTAASAEERSKNLEHDNLNLRRDLNAETGKVAGLQRDATDAKAAQQKVEIELAKQREKSAIAEKALADLRQAALPRRLTQQQQAILIGLLTGEPRGRIGLECAMGDGEGNAFATQIDGVFRAAGWETAGVTQVVYSGGDPVGFGIMVRDAITAPPYAARIQRAFFSVGFPLDGVVQPLLPQGKVQIIVGHHPPLPH